MGQVIPFPRKYDPELTYEQLGFELGVSRRKLNHWAAEGMPSLGIGPDGRKRFKLSEVHAWLHAQGDDAA